MESPLISRAEAMAYLGTDRKGLLAVMLAYKITPDPLTGALPRSEVYRIAQERAEAMQAEPPKGKFRTQPQVTI